MALISLDPRVIITIGKKTSFLIREGQVAPPPSTWSSFFYFPNPQMLPANDIPRMIDLHNTLLKKKIGSFRAAMQTAQH